MVMAVLILLEMDSWLCSFSCNVSIIYWDSLHHKEYYQFTQVWTTYTSIVCSFLSAKKNEVPWDVYGLIYFYPCYKAFVSFTGQNSKANVRITFSTNFIHTLGIILWEWYVKYFVFWHTYSHLKKDIHVPTVSRVFFF